MKQDSLTFRSIHAAKSLLLRRFFLPALLPLIGSELGKPKSAARKFCRIGGWMGNGMGRATRSHRANFPRTWPVTNGLDPAVEGEEFEWASLRRKRKPDPFLRFCYYSVPKPREAQIKRVSFNQGGHRGLERVLHAFRNVSGPGWRSRSFKGPREHGLPVRSLVFPPTPWAAGVTPIPRRFGNGRGGRLVSWGPGPGRLGRGGPQASMNLFRGARGVGHGKGGLGCWPNRVAWFSRGGTLFPATRGRGRGCF